VYRARHQAWARGRAEAPASLFTADADRVERFKREARVLASLIIHTSGQSTVSKTPATYRLWCWSWSRATRCTIAFTGARCHSRRHWPSRNRSPTRSTPPIGPRSSIAISNPPTSRSRPMVWSRCWTRPRKSPRPKVQFGSVEVPDHNGGCDDHGCDSRTAAYMSRSRREVSRSINARTSGPSGACSSTC